MLFKLPKAIETITKMDQKLSQSSIFFSIYMPVIVMFFKSTSAQNYFCSNTTMFANNTQYEANLNTLFRFLSSNATNPNGYHRAEAGNGNTTTEVVYGHFLCRGDQNTSSCQDCVTTATTTDLPNHCPNRKEAIIWYDACMVRYSNQSFFGKMDTQPRVVYANVDNVSGNVTRFEQLLGNMMNSVIAVRAANGGSQKKFATDFANYAALQTIYGLGQCTPDLSPSDCNRCLKDGIQTFKTDRQGAQTLQPSCNVRYEMFAFFDLSSLAVPPRQVPSGDSLNSRGYFDRRKKKFFLASLLGALSTSAVVFVLLLFGIRHYNRKITSNFYAGELNEIRSTLDSLQYDFNTIKIATCKFAADNKVGQGGFGEVYKGKLKSGQEIAVKRLSKNSGQGIEQFKNEVVLVAKLQHNNLVKLLGYCLSSKELMLVYEFLPNSSLDRFLFGQSKKAILDWDTRFKIIVGIARGLLYLHEDSRLKVIHRDLKPSNILLDKHMNPKISDFGLAKHFGVDETQGDTKRIAGTVGVCFKDVMVAYFLGSVAISGLMMLVAYFTLSKCVCYLVKGY